VYYDINPGWAGWSGWYSTHAIASRRVEVIMNRRRTAVVMTAAVASRTGIATDWAYELMENIVRQCAAAAAADQEPSQGGKRGASV
jgi:hypothetical protein